MKTKNKNITIITFIFLITLSVLWILPLLSGISTSFKGEFEYQTAGFKFLPATFVLSNYTELLTNNNSAPILKWLTNSFIISVSHTILVVTVVSLSAFAYSRLEFKGRDKIFMFLMATMMFPSVVNLIPTYKIVSSMGLVNTYMAAIIPGVAGVFNIFLVKQFMLNIPKDYDEAAKIDGATDLQIFLKIILPMIKPILMVVTLFSFTGSWNDFLWPSIVFNDIDSMTVTSGLQLLQGVYRAKHTLLISGAIVAIIPTFVLFLFSQKHFMQSMSLSGGVKG